MLWRRVWNGFIPAHSALLSLDIIRFKFIHIFYITILYGFVTFQVSANTTRFGLIWRNLLHRRARVSWWVLWVAHLGNFLQLKFGTFIIVISGIVILGILFVGSDSPSRCIILFCFWLYEIVVFFIFYFFYLGLLIAAFKTCVFKVSDFKILELWFRVLFGFWLYWTWISFFVIRLYWNQNLGLDFYLVLIIIFCTNYIW